MKVSTVEQMRALDQRAISEYGVPDQILMENAGLATCHHVLDAYGVDGQRFAVVCGLGNNGGDGLVVARKLHSSGGHVTVLVVGDPERYSGSSAANLEMVLTAGIDLVPEASIEQITATLAGADVVVDGLLGTGLVRDVDGRYAEVVQAINRADAVVVSLDIPSGIDGNTGRVRGVAVEADATVTYGLPKLGNLLYPGADRCGRLLVSHISFPPQLQDSAEIQVEVNLPPPLPPRAADGHKGSFGDALCIAGAASYYGAPTLASLSMLRAGGGYSRLAAPRSVVPTLATTAPEVVFVPQDETPAGSLALAAERPLLEHAESVDVVVMGPGLSLDDETRELVRRLTQAIDRPLVVDGDGLTALADDLTVLLRRNAPTVLTPHPGEMARLVDTSVAEIREDPIGVVQGAARDLDAIVVLKGAHSLVGLPDGTVRINPTGSSAMATAGSGDVLTGTIAAMYGLGLDLDEAVCAGVFVHGLAGDLAGEQLGPDGVIARDILDSLPEAVADYREEYAELLEDCYGTIERI
jgi:NAD(P)H-hydrate epimerase